MDTIKVTSSEGVEAELTLEQAKQRIKSLEIQLAQVNDELKKSRKDVEDTKNLLRDFSTYVRQIRGTVGLEPSSNVTQFIDAEDRRNELEKQFK